MINNIELLAYIRENLSLARTIVIKNENLALSDNRLMKLHYGLDSGSDKSKWRYYLNLNGEYHITDEMMQVKSLDDNELIDFTKANLEQHPATKKAYRLGGYYFSRLNAQYPHQSDLIQGIINPISPEESIAADNFQILRYTKEYVNWNETQLIPALQDDINKNAYQFYDTEYMYTDNLMSPALIAVMEKCVFEFLLECRHENRQTRHAHPFYIWSYLQSKGISPIYKDLLNERQTMWLFRNIDYVLRNLGKEKTFQELIDILLTERNIPLSKYDLILSTEDMRDTLKPEPYYFAQRLNLIEKKGNGEGLHKVSTVMLKENPESLDNEINYDQFLPNTREESAFGEQATYPIKVLDSELVDTTNRKPETIYTILNNELIYLAGNDLYNINLDIEEPRTGVHHRVTVKEAIVMWHHLLNLYNGAECDTIHKFYYQDVLRVTPPKLDELLNVGTKPFITSEWCKDLLNTYIPQIRMVSPSVFYENSLAIFNLKWVHQKMYSRWLSIGYYSRRKNAVSAMYETGFVSLTDETSYSAFMEKFDISFDGYTKDDYFRLMWELWKKMSGWDQFTHVTIGQIQSGMLGLMKFLSSYSVQYVYQTVMEEGWYEGGLDLFTENPILLDHNESESQPELEANTTRWLPVHHRAIKDAEIEIYYFENSEFEYWDVITDMIEQGKIMQSPMLYDYDDDDDTGGDNVHDAYTVDMTNKLRNYCGSLPYNPEDLIPEGGSRASDHVLKEMIVDSFEGVATVGPWTVSDIIIVNNHLDNKGVADDVDGYDYGKIVKTESFTKNGVAMNRYYVGFVPALLDAQVIKLDLLAIHSETGETLHVRFDYNIVSKQNTWSISYEIPKTVKPETPFEVTPTITGLSLGTETIVEEKYVVNKDVAEYLTVELKDGKVIGEFLKIGWPDDLPVIYVLQTSNGGSDELLSRHYYYMRGLIPTDRYYNPITDPVFDPVVAYNEADVYAMTLETFTMTASKNGWEAVDLYIKKNADGSVPTDIVKTDYEGIKDFLTPRLADTPYTDKDVDGVTMRTFRWKYAVATEDVSIPMVLALRNTETGAMAYKEFTYTPKVLDHNAIVNYTIHRSTEFKIPINRMREVSLGVDGYGDNITIINGAGIPVAAEGNDTHIIFSYGGESDSILRELIVPGYVIKTIGMPEIDSTWGIKVTAQTKAANGKTLTLYPYNLITLTPDQFGDYDDFDKPNVKISAWGDYPLYSHAYAGTRFAIDTLDNAWEVSSVDISKFIDSSLDALTTSIYDHLGNPVFSDLTPTVTVGRSQDGNEIVPEGKDFWFTIYALGNREVLGEGENMLSVPAYITFTNPVINETKTLQLYVTLRIISQEIKRAEDEKNPTEILPGIDNHIVPDWVGLPYALYGDANETLNEGYFFGTNLYSGGIDYQDKPVCIWNEDDHTADIMMPDGPLTEGKGFRIFNKRTYRAIADELTGGSLQDVTYYPYIDYTVDEVKRYPIPKPDDLDLTDLTPADFFKGVRSSYVTLFNSNKLYELGWKITNANLEVIGADDESDYIITTLHDVSVKSDAYASGIQTTAVHDAPDGKTDYNSAYVSFVPAKEGTLTLGVILTAEYIRVAGVEQRTYRHEITVDVKPQEGTVAFDSRNPDPWWLVDEETYNLVQLSDITGDINSKTLTKSFVNVADSAYITARIAVNTLLSSELALGVKVKESYSSEMTVPQVVVDWNVKLNGYADSDPRAVRYYFGMLPIKADHVYQEDDITLDVIGFAPDVVFNPMNRNESYTERYVYNTDSRGWYVTLMRLQENQDWMNHFFIYDGQVFTDSRLGQFTSQDITIDRDTTAPEGKYYYLPRYGGRLTGQYNIVIQIALSNNHTSKGKTRTLNYRTTRTVQASNIRLNLGYEKFYLGHTIEFTGGMENIPSSDLHNGMITDQYYFNAVGSEKNYFTLYKTDPISCLTSANYPEGEGKGIMLAMAVPYDSMKSGIMETETWIRAYRGEQIIPDADIMTKIEYPEEVDFSIQLLPSVLFEGVSCTLGYVYDITSATEKNWTCADNGLAVYGTDEQSSVMIDTIGGKQFSDERIYAYGTAASLPSDSPVTGDNYRYGYVTFVPAQSGTQTIDIHIVLEHTSGKVDPYTLSLSLDVNIGNNEGRVYYKDEADPWFPVDREINVKTLLADYSGTLSSDVVTVAGVPDYYSDALTATVRQKELYVKTLMEFGGLDRSFVTGHTIVVNGYDTGDKRAVRTYYGVLTVNNKHVYDLDNLTPELVDLQPEIIFEEMEKFTSYTERYSYLRAPSSGWIVTSTRIVVDETWMNHIFEYDGLTSTNSQLFAPNNFRRTYDKDVSAPADRWYSTPRYGGRTLGAKEVIFEITVTTEQFGSLITGVINYKQTRTIIEANIGATLTYEKLLVGEVNPVVYDSVNVPRPDLKQGVILSNVYRGKLGKSSGYFTYKSGRPSTLEIDSGYQSGSNGVMLTSVYAYTTRNAGHNAHSDTDDRVYRTEVIVPDSDITKPVTVPEINDFDFTLLDSTLIQGVVCTLAFMYDDSVILNKGYTSQNAGLTAYGTNAQSDVMVNNVEGVTFNDGYLYSYGTENIVPADAPEKTKTYRYGYVSFVPAKEGQQEIEVTIATTNGNETINFTFPVDVTVLSHEGSIDYDDRDAKFFYLGADVHLTTTLSGYSGSFTSDIVKKALMIPRDETYFNVTLSGDDITVRSLKDVEDIDRGMFVSHDVTIAGYVNNDKRAARTYYDIVWIDNTHVYSDDNLKLALIDFKEDIVFEEMEANTAYTERYSYLRESPSGWKVGTVRLIKDDSWMVHIFEYDGEVRQEIDYLETLSYNKSADLDITAPDDRWFALPMYGGRKVGEYEVVLEISIANENIGAGGFKYIYHRTKRNVVDANIGAKLGYSELHTGQSNSMTKTLINIPRPDLKAGVTIFTAMGYSFLVGSKKSYFVFNNSSTAPSLRIGNYPVGEGNGVMVGLTYKYTYRRATNSAPSSTDLRIYRAEVIIPDEDITSSTT